MNGWSWPPVTGVKIRAVVFSSLHISVFDTFFCLSFTLSPYVHVLMLCIFSLQLKKRSLKSSLPDRRSLSQSFQTMFGIWKDISKLLASPQSYSYFSCWLTSISKIPSSHRFFKAELACAALICRTVAQHVNVKCQRTFTLFLSLAPTSNHNK